MSEVKRAIPQAKINELYDMLHEIKAPPIPFCDDLETMRKSAEQARLEVCDEAIHLLLEYIETE